MLYVLLFWDYLYNIILSSYPPVVYGITSYRRHRRKDDISYLLDYVYII